MLSGQVKGRGLSFRWLESSGCQGRVGITYSNGQSLGDPSSPVQLSSSIVGDRPIPTRAMPEVVARVGVDLDPVDVTDADDARWLRACLWPDQPERVARLEAEMALAATAPPLLLQGDAVEVVPGAFARVPADALPVVTTTWFGAGSEEARASTEGAGERRPQAAARPRLAVPGMRGVAGPGHQRGGQRRQGRLAGGVSLPSAGKTRARPGTARRSRNPPDLTPQSSVTGGNSAPQGRAEVNAAGACAWRRPH